MKNSFTLIESLVVIVIIGILSLIIFPSYQNARQNLALQRSASSLAQDIRRVQEMAMSAQEYSDCLGTDDYKYGYGIYLEESEAAKYKLFADCNGDGNYSSGADEIVEEVEFEKEVEISQLSSPSLKIIFTPPDPIVTIKPSSVDIAFITIINDNGQTRTIFINKVGLIDIN